MLKAVVLLCAVFCVVIEARPKWQFLPPVPGYVPVYIRPGDTPLEQINPELAEAFHALPAGRSASKQIDASPEIPELSEHADQPGEEDQPQADQPREDQPEQVDQPKDAIPEQPDDISAVDRRPYEKKVQKKKATEITKPVERR